jgi:hypothetical protein
MTSSANRWNEVYKLATGKRNNDTQITILRKPDGSLTDDTRETLKQIWSTLHRKIKKTTILTTTNKPEHNLKNLWTRPMTKTSPWKKSGMQ